MATLVADQAQPAAEAVTPPGAGGTGGPDPVAPPAAAEPARSCPRCSGALAPGQDWCLQCGTGAPGAVSGQSWRPAAGILVVTGALVLGAAAAAWAALGAKAPQRALSTTTVAAAPRATTPPVTTPATTPTTPTAKPPKIPLTAQTPPPAITPTTPVETKETGGTQPAGETGKGSTGTGTGTKKGHGKSAPEALVLDTDASQTYNPYGYPESTFGDPSLAIDGDPTTAWTAQLNPATAPGLAEGVVLSLNTPTRVSALRLITSTPGMTVQIYGTTEKTPPTSIVDNSWVALSPSIVEAKPKLKVKLRHSKSAWRYVVLWISKAPATMTATGQVSVDELELFPAAKKTS